MEKKEIVWIDDLVKDLPTEWEKAKKIEDESWCIYPDKKVKISKQCLEQAIKYYQKEIKHSVYESYRNQETSIAGGIAERYGFYEEAAKLYKNNKEYEKVGYCYDRLRKTKEAKKYYRKAIDELLEEKGRYGKKVIEHKDMIKAANIAEDARFYKEAIDIYVMAKDYARASFCAYNTGDYKRTVRYMFENLREKRGMYGPAYALSRAMQYENQFLLLEEKDRNRLKKEERFYASELAENMGWLKRWGRKGEYKDAKKLLKEEGLLKEINSQKKDINKEIKQGRWVKAAKLCVKYGLGYDSKYEQVFKEKMWEFAEKKQWKEARIFAYAAKDNCQAKFYWYKQKQKR